MDNEAADDMTRLVLEDIARRNTTYHLPVSQGLNATFNKLMGSIHIFTGATNRRDAHAILDVCYDILEGKKKSLFPIERFFEVRFIPEGENDNG